MEGRLTTSLWATATAAAMKGAMKMEERIVMLGYLLG